MEASSDTAEILFIGKSGDKWSESAAAYIKTKFPGSRIVFSKRSDPFPAELLNWKGDLLISYLAQWIIPASLLANARIAAINFHPGPPEYPGIGCTNFAVYHGEKQFGVTCHHMQEKVDTGSIIAVRRFPVVDTDSVFSITQKCYETIAGLFVELMMYYSANRRFPVSTENWTRRPFTRRQLNELCVLRPEMTGHEIARRLKATTFGEEVWALVDTGIDRIPYLEALRQGIIAEPV